MPKPETFEEALLQLEQEQERAKNAEAEVAKLSTTKQGLLKDLKKKKGIESVLKAIGLETDTLADLDEEEIADRLKSFAAPPKAPATPSVIDPAAGDGQGKPNEAIAAETRAELAQLRRDLNRLQKEKTDADNALAEERKQRRQAILEQVVTDELQRADCKRPSHLFKLRKDEFRLLDDDKTVVCGSEDNPVSLREAVVQLKDDDEYAPYFAGSGISGSGATAPGRVPGATIGNPFSTDSLNATQAARLWQADKQKAQRLMMEARSAGKLDPVMARAFANS
jgi:hypothetical protein